MKHKIFVFILGLLFCAPFCRGWVLDDEMAEKMKSGQQTLLADILKGNPIFLAILADQWENISAEDIKTLFTDALNSWRTQTAAYIYAAGREEEFSDVLAALNRPLDVVLAYTNEESGAEYSYVDLPAEWEGVDETPGAEEPFAAFDFYQTPSLSCTW